MRQPNGPLGLNFGAAFQQVKDVASQVASQIKTTVSDPKFQKTFQDVTGVINTYQQSQYGPQTGIGSFLPANKNVSSPAPANTPAYILADLILIDQFGRTKVKRKRNAGLLGSTENTTLLDIFLPKDEKGKPALTMQHAIDPQSILYLSAGLGLASLAAGLIIKKF